MVTSRQVARGVFRTMRAMDRAAKQAERQRVVRQHALHRQAHLNASAAAVEEYDAIVEALTGAHRVTFTRLDWLTTATAPLLGEPERQDDEEAAAQARLDGFVPGWFTRLLKREERVRKDLENELLVARSRDDLAHGERVDATARQNDAIRAAQRLVEGAPDAIVHALEMHSGLGSLPYSVEGLDTLFVDDRVIAVVDGLDLEDMPEESVSLLKSGKASFKALPAGKRYEMHRDALCSAAIRVALEFLSTLPIEAVEVVMLTDILDRATGHIDAKPVLYLRVAEQALRTLNLSRTDAAALAERLGGHMDWSKRDGFRAINAAAYGVEVDR